MSDSSCGIPTPESEVINTTRPIYSAKWEHGRTEVTSRVVMICISPSVVDGSVYLPRGNAGKPVFSERRKFSDASTEFTYTDNRSQVSDTHRKNVADGRRCCTHACLQIDGMVARVFGVDVTVSGAIQFPSQQFARSCVVIGGI